MASGSDHVKDETAEKDNVYPCGTCTKKKGKVTVNASVFCPTCDVCYCYKCYRCGHDVIGSSNKQLWTKGVEPRDHRYCVRHPGEIVKLYCEQHDQICCKLCLSTNHRFCLEMTELTDMKDDMVNEQHIEEIISDLGQLQTKLEELQGDRVTRVNMIESSFNKCLDKVGHFRREANAAFDDIETNLSKYRRTYLDRFAGDQTINKNILQTLSAYKTQFEKSCEQHSVFDIKSCNDWLGQSSATLTKMDELDIKCNMVQIHDDVVTKIVGEIKECDNVLFTFNNFCIRVEEDTVECRVGGICQMHDGSFILTDSANKKLKKLGKSYKVVDHYKLDTEPRGICCVSEKEAAVAMGDKTVKLVAVGDTLEPIMSFEVFDEDVWDVTMSSGQVFTISIYEIDRLYLKNFIRSDNEMQLIRDIDLSHKSERDINMVSFGDTDEIYFVCNNKIVSVDKNGKTIGTKEIKTPSGVCVDELNNVYVSENDSNRILKLDMCLEEVSVVVKESDNFTDPDALCFDRNAGRLIVAKQRGDFIYLV